MIIVNNRTIYQSHDVPRDIVALIADRLKMDRADVAAVIAAYLTEVEQ